MHDVFEIGLIVEQQLAVGVAEAALALRISDTPFNERISCPEHGSFCNLGNVLEHRQDAQHSEAERTVKPLQRPRQNDCTKRFLIASHDRAKGTPWVGVPGAQLVARASDCRWRPNHNAEQARPQQPRRFPHLRTAGESVMLGAMDCTTYSSRPPSTY
eukprot:scaffold1042_cov401-Prasinococcus_capsulatus_cf.AAC.41